MRLDELTMVVADGCQHSECAKHNGYAGEPVL
jgi:hypothetical protein